MQHTECAFDNHWSRVSHTKYTEVLPGVRRFFLGPGNMYVGAFLAREGRLLASRWGLEFIGSE